MTELEPSLEHREHSCVFCRIVRGENEASMIRESDSTMSLMSLEGNPIVIPKKHIESPLEDAELASEVFGEAVRLSTFIQDVFGTNDFNILTNVGKRSGQEVPHFHVHILPRELNDNLVRIRHIPPLHREILDSLAAAFRDKITFTSVLQSQQ